MRKEWVVDGEFYHKSKSKFKKILGSYGFSYNWKERPNFVWRKDPKTWMEGEFDREELPDETVDRRSARLILNYAAESPMIREIVEKISVWAKGYEKQWTVNGREIPRLKEKVIKSWRGAFRGVRRRKAPRGWINAMINDCQRKLTKLDVDTVKKGEENMRFIDYIYPGD